METDHDVIVVGGGQAGLAAGYHLTRANIPFVILDAGTRVGEAWRQRWDSLTLFTVARYSALPGLLFPGDPEHFPGKDEVADYLAQYAQEFQLPVHLDSRVTSLSPADGGYQLTTASDEYLARHVIVATGAYQRPHIPALSDQLDDLVVRMHSNDYSRPSQIPDGTVLVVGAANSGANIAEDLAATHQVVLSQGSSIPHMPRRLLGKSLHFWGDKLGLIGASLDTLRGRTQRGELLVGPSLRSLARRHGLELAGRTISVDGRTVRFEGGRQIDVDAVIWATGYRADYEWINVPDLLNENGKPHHERGQTRSRGLYFVGMKDQYSRGSSLLYWVKDDADYVVGRILSERA